MIRHSAIVALRFLSAVWCCSSCLHWCTLEAANSTSETGATHADVTRDTSAYSYRTSMTSFQSRHIKAQDLWRVQRKAQQWIAWAPLNCAFSNSRIFISFVSKRQSRSNLSRHRVTQHHGCWVKHIFPFGVQMQRQINSLVDIHCFSCLSMSMSRPSRSHRNPQKSEMLGRCTFSVRGVD